MEHSELSADEIYAQLAEFSDESFRPHPYVMGFLYKEGKGTGAGGLTVWWHHEYDSIDFDDATYELVDWMNFHNCIIDPTSATTLFPLEGNSLCLPGILTAWNLIGEQQRPDAFSKRIQIGVRNAQQS